MCRLMLVSLMFLVCVFAANSQQTNNCPLNNICFALDQSFSIDNDEYKDVQNFTISASLDIDSRTVGTIYSAYAFSTSSAVIQAPTMDLKGKFIPAINGPRRFRGGTRIRQGLQRCLDAQSGQPGNLVTVLLTDGRSGDNFLSLRPSFVSAGIDIVTVGVGDNLDEIKLKQLAKTPEFFFKVDDTKDLVRKITDAVNKICEVSIADSCEEAYQSCEFQFMGKATVPTYKIGVKPDVVFTDKIVSRMNPKVGILNTNDLVVEFLEDGAAKPITSFGNPRLTPTHFKPLSIRKRPLSSGIGHQTFTGNQKQISKGKCVRIFFSNFQLISTSKPGPRVIGNVNNAKKTDNKCVVFKTM